MSKLLEELARVEMVAVTNTRHILINTEGKVHRNTYIAAKDSKPASSRHNAVSENKVREQHSISNTVVNKQSNKVIISLWSVANNKPLQSCSITAILLRSLEVTERPRNGTIVLWKARKWIDFVTTTVTIIFKLQLRKLIEPIAQKCYQYHQETAKV